MLARFIAGLVLILSSATVAHAADDPFMGTWRLDLAKSKIADNPGVKSKVFAFAPGPDGVVITETLELTAEPGKPHVSTIRYADGKLTKDAAPGLDALLVTKADDRTAFWTTQAKGEIASQLQINISPDGKQMVFHYLWRAADPAGAGYGDRYVYVKD